MDDSAGLNDVNGAATFTNELRLMQKGVCMKIVHVERLIDEGRISSTPGWHKVEQDIRRAIATIEWPPHSGSFTLYPGKHENGVVPIKEACMIHLDEHAQHPHFSTRPAGGKLCLVVCIILDP